MAGDWIMFEAASLDKPEVHAIADEVGRDPDEVLGKLLRFWAWCDAQSPDGHLLAVKKLTVDRITFCPGFGAALEKVGWLAAADDGLLIPNFDRPTGKPANTRARNTRNKKNSPASGDKNHRDAVTNQGLEKRREESIKYPTLEQAKSVAPQAGVTPEQAERWWHTREASGWMRANAAGGSVPVSSNWQSDMKITAPQLNDLKKKSYGTSWYAKRYDSNCCTSSRFYLWWRR